MTEITVHIFRAKQVRVIPDQNGAPWFVAIDVARVLDYDRAERVVRMMDGDERGTRIVGTPSGDQELSVISEPGLYKAIGRSRHPEAKEIDRWVRHDVLPSIRKTGAYVAPNALPPVDVSKITRKQLAFMVIEAEERAERAEAHVAELAPKAAFHDEHMNAAGLYTMAQAAAALAGKSDRWLLQKLREAGWIDRRPGSGANVPRQFVKDAGFVVVKLVTIMNGADAVPQSFVTPKGFHALRLAMRDGELFLAGVDKLRLSPPSPEGRPT